MRPIDRFQAIMAVVFFVGAIISAWRVVVTDAKGIGYVPFVLAGCAGVFAIAVLRHRKRNDSKKRE